VSLGYTVRDRFNGFPHVPKSEAISVIHSSTMLVSLSLVANASTDFTTSGPKEAKTTAKIIACAEKDDVQGGLRSKPHVFSAELRSPEQQAFVAWYNPYSGRAACHV
jgi:hypothetical protein